MGKKKIKGGIGITAGGDVTFGDVSGQVAIGKNITQTQSSIFSGHYFAFNPLAEGVDVAVFCGDVHCAVGDGRRVQASVAIKCIIPNYVSREGVEAIDII